ncbi:MAG: hypothetical protein A2186_03250 [Candidatus Levybacteria bacterium RIFOXYA1_FULL_41_10]|nr:MAG: S23 ribosomal protein [Candidatus Levybacteria bacterium GW2011_GWA2_36_13]KKR51544.1 MAG: S23 ribosomal protein [Candidatus Levybacteria bacterium GW2011_GWC1_40_19]KKR72913.1 MAG: S23 ribosomal protein [Candidatus Levybacteria bacterium GW2011_GWC2_40_7]OGH26088.1 MAG: hypothetical protein A3D82_03745 [Candidatus Levybacteria bacterium RIFCSPHIGHO2_02_FULL_40_29]OGH49674.1 MAG: hypothetical protein A3J18_02650 [Candidatus Levybacteria bacterium RIFCSPLOWO2_02_FULL_40_18]OGH52154.1 MA
MEDSKIRTFKDLITWQEAHKLALLVYSMTNNFPRSEAYSLVDQMRRCVISISSNIAEGFSRNSQKEKRQFYYMALGSLTELQNQLLLSKDLKYLNKEKFSEIDEQTTTVHKLINGLIKSSKNYT